MEGFEEVLPMEGMFAPLDVRRELRQMFSRWLPRSYHPRAGLDSGERVNELDLLSLCEHFRLEYPGEAKNLAKTWDESAARKADGGPLFNELVQKGWVFYDGGRWIMQGSPPGTSFNICYPTPSTQCFLEGLSKPRLTAKTDSQPTKVKTLAEKILAEFWLEQHVPIENPNWFLGRLWEQLCPAKPLHRENNVALQQTSAPEENLTAPLFEFNETNADAVDCAFLEWSAWCHVIEGYGEWDSHWTLSQKQFCREAAHRALARQTLWGEWDCDLERYVDVLLKTYAIPQNQIRFVGRARKVPPDTLVARASWIASREVEHLMMERLILRHEGPNIVSFAFSLLCSELEQTEIRPNLLVAADELLSFAVSHPMALLNLQFRINTAPMLLVDMLLVPATACLGVQWTVAWQPMSGHYSDRNRSREAQTKTFAVQDALSFIAYYLNACSLNLKEYASLISWCYTDSTAIGRAIADPRRPVGRQLLGMIAKHNEQVQSETLRHLVGLVTYENNVPRACFSGVLDAMNSLPLVTETTMKPVIATYSEFACKQHLDWTDVEGLSPSLSRCLVAVACAQAASDRDAFLIPFDGMILVQEASQDEKPTIRSSVARTMRVHIRLLARAVSAWTDETLPIVLSDTLKKLILRSVIEHDEKGRIGALTDRYSPSNFLNRETGSPAQDLAAAWRKLDNNNQKELLQVFMLSDDPVLLAELCQYLPATAKVGIKARLQQLKPGEASIFWTWTELQHRIETLLVADEYDLAREHMECVREELDRAPQQSRLALFTLELQLFLKEKNWKALDNSVLPSTLRADIVRQANDELDFYKATSQLLRLDGDLAFARTTLQRLAAKPKEKPSYRKDYFAIAVQQILGPTLHPLSGTDKVAGEHLLDEINNAIATDDKLASTALLVNRALLLIALSRPEAALESLAQPRSKMRSSELEIAVVIAKNEMGFHAEAMAILDAAIIEFDQDKRLVLLKEDLQADNTASKVASASIAVDYVSSIRVALHQLTGLNFSQIGDILGPPGQGLRGYLIREVSNAVASLQRMAGMLRDRKDPMREARFEDHLNTAVREVLNASLNVAKWNVSDQSLGGITANGNPGERDLVIRSAGKEIAVYEALVCNGLARKNIKNHFDKLLPYGACDIYFHVIYSYAKEIKPILKYVRKMLEHDIPSTLLYRSCEELTPADFEVCGYFATYSLDHRDIAVVFLIADLKIRTV